MEDIIDHFTTIAKTNTYSEYFTKLGYWKIVNFYHEQVIELVHEESNVELLLLYFLAQNKMSLPLSLNDTKIQHLVHRIFLSNEKKY